MQVRTIPAIRGFSQQLLINLVGGLGLASLVVDAGEAQAHRKGLVARFRLSRSIEAADRLLESSGGFVVVLFALVEVGERLQRTGYLPRLGLRIEDGLLRLFLV